MTSAFDPRIIQVGIAVGDKVYTYRDLAISVSGRKYTTALMNECELRIFNLTAEHRNNILTHASPLKLGKNDPVTVLLDIGRESYGTFRLFEGNVISCNVTQPPDIGISMRAMNSNFAAGVIIGSNQSSLAKLSTISESVAKSMGLRLEFQATDKLISNYSHSGAAIRQIDKLNAVGGIVAFIDNSTLVVIDSNKPRKGDVRKINAQTGMVGIPQVTEYGCIVKMMIDNSISLGGPVEVESKINPAVNGPYRVVGIEFEAANRENPFWYTLACMTPDRYMGAQ